RKQVAKQLRRDGLSQTAIADRLGVSQKTISNDLKK
ncbi:helix-turn-helix domain-containing protein, partial [Acinetobacter johnsonii]